MIQKDKELLLQDLCARLPYEVKAYVKNWSKMDRKWYEGIYTIKSVFPSLNEIHVQSENGSVDVMLGYSDFDIKPYLFPMSLMTEVIKNEIYQETGLYDIFEDNQIHIEVGTNFVDVCKLFNILNKYHLDYNGLIPKGLANDATGLSIY